MNPNISRPVPLSCSIVWMTITREKIASKRVEAEPAIDTGPF